ncbi:glycosyltransferase [Nocardia pneumoniae]|uniref:glycosyltransferase n=1 Tax=Nocardia pneumoniae TaxID=228601 RepID=UPI001FDF8E28|nr:glycosyltransferase [Nocardia pneumoniae]
MRNHDNVGLTRAINQGAATVDTEWLLIANPHTQLSPGAIAALVETALSDERIGLVGHLSAPSTATRTPRVAGSTSTITAAHPGCWPRPWSPWA